MSKILTVFGATGNQGGSVVAHVLADPVLSKEFKIRAVTRDVNKPAAKALAAKGVELVTADMMSPELAVKGAHTVFLVTNFWETMSADTEIKQGKSVADACKAAGVKHLIYSSLIDTNKATAGRLSHISHFDGKAEIERYIKAIGQPSTFVLLGLFMTGVFSWTHKQDDGSFQLQLPVPGDKAQVPVIDAGADTGKFVVAAIKNFPQYDAKRIYAAAQYITPDQMAAEIAQVTGKRVTFQQIPDETFTQHLPQPIRQELLENMKLFVDTGYYAGADITESLSLLDGKPKSWKQFAQEHKDKWE